MDTMDPASSRWRADISNIPQPQRKHRTKRVSVSVLREKAHAHSAHFCVTVVYWECVVVGLEYVEFYVQCDCVCLFVCVSSLYINKNAQERDRE